SVVVVQREELKGWRTNAVVHTHTASVQTDFSAPVVDLNADGRGDVALLKTFKLSAAAADPSDECERVVGVGRLVGKFGGAGSWSVSRLMTLPWPLFAELTGLPTELPPPELQQALVDQFPGIHKSFAGPAQFVRLTPDLFRAVLAVHGGFLQFDPGKF